MYLENEIYFFYYLGEIYFFQPFASFMNLKKVKYSLFDLSFVKWENWIGFENNFKQ